MYVEDIAMSISQENLEKRPVLIGIEGFGGSGKSTNSLKLAGLLHDAVVIRVDDFIIKENLSTGDWDLLVFDRQRLESEVLAPASKSLAVTYRKLLWDTNTLSSPVSIGIPKYLIIEGIACYHPSIAHYYDYKIWVDTPIDIANKRGRARDAGNENEKYWDLWSKNDIAYQAKYRPEVVADFVLTNFEQTYPI